MKMQGRSYVGAGWAPACLFLKILFVRYMILSIIYITSVIATYKVNNFGLIYYKIQVILNSYYSNGWTCLQDFITIFAAYFRSPVLSIFKREQRLKGQGERQQVPI